MSNTVTFTDPNQAKQQIAAWLIVCAILIFLMIMLGGATRLTQSGLSIVEWKPVTGIIPPLSESDWMAEFEKYKAYPEFIKVNANMNLQGFKSIYLFEYAHRALGRLIGIFFLLPYLYFFIRKKIDRLLHPKLIALFVLGGLQGALGWYMVKSGLVDNPRVSQYRLVAHLGMAVIIYAYMIWLAIGLLQSNRYINNSKVRHFRFSLVLTTLIFITMLSGGFVAGTHAGKAFNTFPLMGDSFIPNHLLLMSPAWINFFENTITIQFTHRMLAYTIIILVISLVTMIIRGSTTVTIKRYAYLLLFMLGVQVTLGITTLLLHVPVLIATAHQGGAVLLLTASVLLLHQLRFSSSS